jgi:hypothetical protein
MHPLVQDGDDVDVSVREPAPVDDMALIAEEVAIDAELGRIGREPTPRESIFSTAANKPVI